MYGLLTGLLQPYLLLFVLLAAAIANLWRRRREPIRRLLVLTLAFVALAVLSIPAIAHLSLGTLEWRYPPAEQRPARQRPSWSWAAACPPPTRRGSVPR